MSRSIDFNNLTGAIDLIIVVTLVGSISSLHVLLPFMFGQRILTYS